MFLHLLSPVGEIVMISDDASDVSTHLDIAHLSGGGNCNNNIDSNNVKELSVESMSPHHMRLQSLTHSCEGFQVHIKDKLFQGTWGRRCESTCEWRCRGDVEHY